MKTYRSACANTRFLHIIKDSRLVYVFSVYDSNEYASDAAKQAIIVKVGVCSFLQHDMMTTVTMLPINPDVNMSITVK